MPPITRPLLIIAGALLVVLTTCSPARSPHVPLAASLSNWQPTVDVADQAPTGPDPLRAIALPTGQATLATVTPPAAPTVLPTITPEVVPSDVPTPSVAPAMDAYLNALTAQGFFSGAAVVVRDGQIVLSQGYGMADRPNNVANSGQTRLRVASLSKQFTAVAILILQQRGQLNVRDSVCAHLPDCPPAWQPVQIRHLLNHTSGIPNYTDFADFEGSEMLPATPVQLLSRFRNLPLNFAPGTLYSYGNSGYVVLGAIIEQVSGQSYADFMRAAIFEPLGMAHTAYSPGEDGAAPWALGYTTVDRPAPFIHTSTLFASGGLSSTSDDMARWINSFYGDQLLSAELRGAMFTPFLGDYGFGWKVDRVDGRVRYWHPGSMNGCSSFILILPDERLGVAVLSNLAVADARGIAHQLVMLARQ